MKQFKDPFEAAFEEQEESPPDSPVPPDDLDMQTSVPPAESVNPTQEEDDLSAPSTSALIPASNVTAVAKNKDDDEEEEEEENMEVELSKYPTGGGDPDKMAKMQAILSQFTEEQMNSYESFRRSGFQKATMRRLLTSVTGSQKIKVPITIVMSGIAKMFVGEVVETARMVMAERRESGPIRPCHIIEAYRRLKLEGKVPKKAVPRLFR